MKRLLLLIALCLCCLIGCNPKPTYEPDFTLADGYHLQDDRISATVIGEGDLPLSDFLRTNEAVTVFADSTADRFAQGADARIPLQAGENRMVIRFSNGRQEKEYDLHIRCIAIQGFSVTILDPEKTYHIGEAFDKNTVSVVVLTKDGESLEITQYEPEYEFSSLGKSTVGIELDGYYESFSVMVTEEYRPGLDGNASADGVQYEIEEDTAVLLRATDKTGFFAVPSAVFFEEREYPVTAIAPLAFEGAAITSLQIPESVRTIGDEAFSGCKELEWIEMPETLTSIGPFAFSDCLSLQSIEIPDGITEIRNGTFDDCTALSRIALPEGLEIIGERAFYGCTALETVRFPKTLRIIGQEAFRKCRAFSTAVVENLTAIGDEAFAECESLSVFAAGDIETIGKRIFPEHTDLTVYMRAGSVLLLEADLVGADCVFMKNGETSIVSLPVEFPIEREYPYDETLILSLDDGKMTVLSDYTVSYPKDACGYLPITLEADGFTHTFTIFIVYTEDIALDTDTRGVRYDLDPATGKATLVYVPEWVKRSDIYQPQQEGLFLVPTTLWRDDGMYVVTDIAENVFDHVQNVTDVYIPRLTKE